MFHRRTERRYVQCTLQVILVRIHERVLTQLTHIPGLTRSLVANWEKSERYPYCEARASGNLSGKLPVVSALQVNTVWLLYDFVTFPL